MADIWNKRKRSDAMSLETMKTVNALPALNERK